MKLPLSYYQANYDHLKQLLSDFQKRDRLFSIGRFVVVLTAAFCGYKVVQNALALWVLLLSISLLVFVVLIFVHVGLRKKKRQKQYLLRVNENELRYLKGDLAPFAAGDTYRDSQHLFSHDLDLFGEFSLFQHINRTSTAAGEKHLAEELMEPAIDKINEKQQAIRELTGKLDWRQQFGAAGMAVEENQSIRVMLEIWLASKAKPSLFSNKWFLYALVGVVVILLFNFLRVTSLQNFNILTYALGFNLLLVFSQFKAIKKEYDMLNKVSRVLAKYADLLILIEQEDWQSAELKGLKRKLENNNEKAATALGKLAKLLDGFDQMNNAIAVVLSNGFAHYHLHVLRQLFTWKQQHGVHINTWIEVLAQFDSYHSVANFSFNHPEFSYPTVSEKPVLQVTELGHPLLAPDKCVVNDIDFNSFNFSVLTGSNMSGKSTFLRSLGANLVLAKMGAPVCANNFVFYPYRLLSSMKLADSLNREESYFKAEVLRLRAIKEILETDEPCLLLLDEILRGTNSDDKRKGTRLFMEKVAQYSSIGVVATHDIDIAELAKVQPKVFKAMYFESKVQGGELLFDYQLRQGVCTTPNATELMRNNGII